MIRVGIVGHRFLKQKEASFAAVQCREILKEMQEEHDVIVACSAIAEGADSIFAEAALALNIPLDIVLPFDEYEFDFVEEKALDTFRSLKAAASSITQLPFGPRSNDAYEEGMHWILNGTDIIVAVWNGETNGGRGGTSDAVKHILNDGLDWIYIDIKNMATHVYINNDDIRFNKNNSA